MNNSQTKSDIEPKHLTFNKLLQGRLFRIPPYQRAYSWQTKHRRDMFDDILNLEEKAKSNNKKHFMATIVGLHTDTIPILAADYDKIDIVDGQQRLTTLVILLKIIEKRITDSITPGDRNKRTDEVRVEEQLKELLVKPDEASLILLQTNHDQNEFFVDFIRKGKITDVSAANTVADYELLSAIKECNDFVYNEWKDPVELLSLLYNRLSFIFYQTNDEETVHTIFESLNNRGLDVSPLEIIKNKLMEVVCRRSKGQGNAEEHKGNAEEHINELHRIWGRFYKTVGMRKGIPIDTDALGFATSLKIEKSPPSKVISESIAVDLLTGKNIDNVEFQMSKEGIDVGKAINISKWLLEVANAVDNLQIMMRKPVTDIRQARMLGAAILLRVDFTDEERKCLLDQWEKTTFRIYGLCDNDARVAVGDYVRLAWKTYNEELGSKKLLKKITKIEKNHSANQDYEICEMNFYREPKQRERLRYLLYRYEEHLAKKRGQELSKDQWNLIWKATATDSIEHISPQSKSEDDVFHMIGNLLLLTPEDNSRLSNKDPREKEKIYRKTRLHMAEDVANKIKECNGWNEEHIRNRTNEIRSWIINEYGE